MDLDKQLVRYSMYGNLSRVESLIKEGANVNYDDQAALNAAVKNGYFNIVDILIENGANFYPDKLTEITNDKRMIDYIYELKSEYSNPYRSLSEEEKEDLLIIEASNGNLDEVKKLVLNNVIIREDALLDAIYNNDYDMFDYLYENSDNISPKVMREAKKNPIINKKYFQHISNKEKLNSNKEKLKIDESRLLDERKTSKNNVYTLEELKKFAEELKINKYSTMNKKELINEIKASLKK